MVEKVVNISVKETGMDALRSKVDALENSLESLEDQNESLQKSLKGTSQSVLDNGGAMGLLNDLTGGLAMTVKDAVEAGDLFTKSERAKAIAVKISSVVIGTSTGALKAFRIALVTTGIGALVVGLGLLIANFDKVVKFVQMGIDKFKGLSGTTKNVISVLFPLIGVIRLVTTALEELGIIEDDQTKKLRIQAEERERIRKKELATLTKAKEQIADSYDFEIAKIKASGKDTEKIEAQKRDAILKTLQAQNALDRVRIASGKASQDEIKAWNERQKEIIKTVREIEIAEIESNTRKLEKQKEANEKQKEEAKKLAEDKKRKIEEEFKTFMDFYNKQLEAEANRQNAIAEIRKNYVDKNKELDNEIYLNRLDAEEQAKLKELDNIRGTEEEKIAILKYYEDLRLQNELDKIAEEESKALAELDKLKATEAEKQATKDYYSKLSNEAIINSAQETADKVLQINADKDKKEEENAKALKEAKIAFAGQTLQLVSELAGEGTAIAKGIAVAQATMSGIEGVQNAYSTAQKSPITIGFPAYPIVQASLAGAFSALQIKKILSTKTGGGGSGASGVGGGGGGSVPSAPSFNLVQGTGTNQIAESLATERNPVKAYVVASEVSTQQSLDRNIESGARL